MEPPSDDTSSLERVRQGLYRPEAPEQGLKATLRPEEASTLPRAWESARPKRALGAPHHIRYAYRFFFGAIVFFVLAVAASVFVFYTGSNTVSIDNVELSIQGPTTVAGGDLVPLSIVVTNKNPSAIENVTLEITFPEGTRSASDVSTALPRFNADLGTLVSGASTERSVSAVLFGSEGLTSNIQIAISFGTSRSNARFVKPATYPILISTAPLSVSVDSVSETVSGKSFVMKATVRSNATEAVRGVVLQAQYPTGYVLADSSVTPVGTIFQIGTLKPGDAKVVTLTGVLSGQDNETRVFHFTVGTSKTENDPSLAVPYMTQEATVTITAPFLATAIAINGSSATSPAVAPGVPVLVGVTWANALSVPIENAEIQIALGGTALDSSSVKVQNGFYRSSDHTILFSRDTDSALGVLAPGKSGLGSFTFSTLANAPRNSAITLTVSIVGERPGQSGVPEQVSASLVKVIKLVSAVSFTATSLHLSGPFTNTGPVPPVAEVVTAYTVSWGVTNSGNDLASGVVTATLPVYVTFSGATAPADGSITYDPSSHLVTWRVGEMAGGSTRQGAFQVLLTPSTSQRGTIPALTSAPQFTGFDRYAQVQVTTAGAVVSTDTQSDPGYTPNKASVQ